jgi:hypothetical protein
MLKEVKHLPNQQIIGRCVSRIAAKLECPL